MRLQGKTIGYFVAQEVEDLEFWVPVMRLREEGAQVIVIGLSNETVHGKHGLEMTPDVSIEEAPKADTLDGIVIPGGWAPDKLRRSQGVLQLVRDIHAQGKIVGTICHGGWVPISAGIIKGRKATGSTGIKMISPTREVSGSTRRRSAKEIWCGGASSRISPLSAGNWLPHSLKERKQ